MADFSFTTEAAIDSEGIWSQVLAEPVADGTRPGLLLDRDGVIVEEVHYLHRPDDVRLIPGAAEVIAGANRAEIAVAIVTNQAGIGYGYYGWREFAETQARILDELDTAGARVDAVFACPFHARGKPPFDHPDHPARKPNPGMLLRAVDRLRIDASRAWIVGDRASDLMAGRRAGLQGGMHVLTGYGGRPGEREAALALADPEFQVRAAQSIGAALSTIPLLAAT